MTEKKQPDAATTDKRDEKTKDLELPKKDAGGVKGGDFTFTKSSDKGSAQ